MCIRDSDDGVVFEIGTISPIREDDIYGGYRVMLNAKFDTLLTPLSIDVSIGDAITCLLYTSVERRKESSWEFPPVRRSGQRSNLRRDRKTQERRSWHCFRIPATDTFPHRYSRTKMCIRDRIERIPDSTSCLTANSGRNEIPAFCVNILIMNSVFPISRKGLISFPRDARYRSRTNR